MSKKTIDTADMAEMAKFDEFRRAVKYVLIKEHGTPELVAEDLLSMDPKYLQDAYEDSANRETMVMEVALELALEPREGGAWVRLDDGQIVIDVNEQVRKYLGSLAEVGLYGETQAEIAQSMLRRGIEVALQVAPPLKRRGP